MSGKKALLIVDNQLGFRDQTYWGPSRSNPKYEQNVIALLAAFRSSKQKPLVVHIVHHSIAEKSPLHPSKSTSAIDPITAPIDGEPIFTKNVNSAFIGTKLEELLRQYRIDKLYICGITTDHCVSTTTRMAGNLHVTDHAQPDGTVSKGEIILIGDATTCFQKSANSHSAETIHAVHVESLEEFATIATTEEVLKDLSTLH